MDFGSTTMLRLCAARREQGNVYTLQLISQRRTLCANFLSRQNVPVGQLQVYVRTDDGRCAALKSILGFENKATFCISLLTFLWHPTGRALLTDL